MTSVDISSSEYISDIQPQNIMASVVAGDEISIGVVPLGQIMCFIEPPPVLPPTNLMSSRGVVPIYLNISWTNNASEIIETIIETNTGSGWTRAQTIQSAVAHTASLAFTTGKLRIFSVTSTGTSAPSNTITV